MASAMVHADDARLNRRDGYIMVEPVPHNRLRFRLGGFMKLSPSTKLAGSAVAGMLVLAMLLVTPVASSAARFTPRSTGSGVDSTCGGTTTMLAPVNGVMKIAIHGHGAPGSVAAASRTSCTVIISGSWKRVSQPHPGTDWGTDNVAAAGVTTVTNGAFAVTVSQPGFQGALQGTVNSHVASGAASTSSAASGVASWSMNCSITFPPLDVSCTVNVGFATEPATGTAAGNACGGTSVISAPVSGKVHIAITCAGASSAPGRIVGGIISVDGLEHSHDTVAQKVGGSSSGVVEAGITTVTNGTFTAPLSVPGFTGKLSGSISTAGAAGAAGTAPSGVASWSVDCEWDYPPFSLHCTLNFALA